MMKRTPLVFAVLILTCLPAARAETVVVDMDRVFSEYHKTRQAEAQVQEMVQAYRQDQERVRAEFQAMQEEFNRLREESAAVELAEDQRREMAQQAAEKLNEMRAAEERFRQEDQNRQRQIEEQGRRLRQRIVDEMLEKVRELAEERNWALVLDSSAVSANGLPVVLRHTNTVEVTGEVIQALNRSPSP